MLRLITLILYHSVAHIIFSPVRKTLFKRYDLKLSNKMTPRNLANRLPLTTL